MNFVANRPEATQREWIGPRSNRTAMPALLDGLDGAEPRGTAHKRPDLKPTSSQLLWIVDTYGF